MSHDDNALYAYIYTLENCKVTDIPTVIDQMRDFIRKNGWTINPNFLQDAWRHMHCADEYYNRCLLNQYQQ